MRRELRTCAGCGETFLGDVRAKWCSEHCRKEQYRTPCKDCGKPTNRSGGSIRCAACSQERTGRLATIRSRALSAQIVEWWNEGKSIKEIAKLLGWTARSAGTHISRMRNEYGYDLPYRNKASADWQRAHPTNAPGVRRANAR